MSEYIKPREAAKRLGCSYEDVLRAIHAHTLPAKKEKKRWQIAESELEKFGERNRRKIEQIQSEIIKAYWAGMGVKGCRALANWLMCGKGIVCEKKGFTERTLYNEVRRAAKEETEGKA